MSDASIPGGPAALSGASGPRSNRSLAGRACSIDVSGSLEESGSLFSDFFFRAVIFPSAPMSTSCDSLLSAAAHAMTPQPAPPSEEEEEEEEEKAPEWADWHPEQEATADTWQPAVELPMWGAKEEEEGVDWQPEQEGTADAWQPAVELPTWGVELASLPTVAFPAPQLNISRLSGANLIELRLFALRSEFCSQSLGVEGMVQC